MTVRTPFGDRCSKGDEGKSEHFERLPRSQRFFERQARQWWGAAIDHLDNLDTGQNVASGSRTAVSLIATDSGEPNEGPFRGGHPVTPILIARNRFAGYSDYNTQSVDIVEILNGRSA